MDELSKKIIEMFEGTNRAFELSAEAMEAMADGMEDIREQIDKLWDGLDNLTGTVKAMSDYLKTRDGIIPKENSGSYKSKVN